MNPFRVAIVADSFTPARDDGTITVRQIVDQLIDTGHDVHVLTATPGVPTYRGVPVHRITGVRKRGARIAALITDFAPDLMHVVTPDVLGRKALKQALRANLPTLVLEQSPLPNYLPSSYVEQVIARSDRYLVTSAWVQDQLRERGIRAHMWAPGVDTGAFAPSLRDRALHRHWARADKEDTPLLAVGYVGGLHKRNGVRRLAELAALAHVRPVIIGAGPQRGWLQERLPHAKFLEPMSTGDLGTAIASLDVLVHPGRRQTCGHPLRAAGACGIPAVGPHAGSAAEIIRDGETGVLYDATDERGIASALGKLSDPSERTRMGALARETALHREWSTAVSELVHEHYPAVLAARQVKTLAS